MGKICLNQTCMILLRIISALFWHCESPVHGKMCLVLFLSKNFVFRSKTYNSQIIPEYDIGGKEFGKSLHTSVFDESITCLPADNIHFSSQLEILFATYTYHFSSFFPSFITFIRTHRIIRQVRARVRVRLPRPRKPS